jgi:hypothetical protein
MFPKSQGILPNTFQEWREHRIAVLEADRAREERKLQQLEASLGMPKVASSFGHLVRPDDRATVLAMPTIWRLGPVTSEDSAPWPSLQELKWEGDDRARTGVGRFLPLPRENGNPTVAWHQRKVVPGQEFDQVRKVPTAEDVVLSQLEDDSPPAYLINSELWEAIDSDL